MEMIPVPLSDNGPVVSPLIAGVWKWGKGGHALSDLQRERAIMSAVDLGITTFDNADIYGEHTAEEDFGRVIARRSSLRDKIQIITKCGIKVPSSLRNYPIKTYDTSRDHIMASVDNSLRMLQTDFIDILLIHRPSPLMDPDEIAGTLFDLIADGKVGAFGVSNFSVSQMSMIRSRIPIVTNQVEASPLHLDPFVDGTFDYLLQHRIRPTIWSPLGSGALFNLHPEDDAVKRIRSVAEQLQAEYDAPSPDMVYLAWLMQHPSRPVPIIGTARPERMESAISSLRIKLTREDWFRIWIAATGRDVP